MPVSTISSNRAVTFPGAVLQVVGSSTSTLTTNATDTYADTTLTATITPSSASSKILVLFSQNGVGKVTNNTGVNIRLVRNGSSILIITDIAAFTGTTTQNRGQCVSSCYLDSPSSTSALTYKTQFMSYSNNSAAYVQDAGTSGATSTITLMEIAA
jgi:hypothetical protein